MKPRILPSLLLATALFLSTSRTQVSAASTDRFLFVSSFTQNTITKIDLDTLTQTTIVSDLDRPEDGICGPDGRIYFAESLARRITRYEQDGSGATPMTMTGGSEHPEGLAFDAAGNLYFNTRSPSHSGIWQIPGADPTTAPINVVPGFANLGEGTAITQNQDIIAAAANQGKIVRSPAPSYGPATDFIVGLVKPVGLAVDPAGDIYVANWDPASFGNSTIEKFADDGTFKGIITAGLDSPRFIELDSEGNIYVANENSGEVIKVTPDGTKTTITTIPGSVGVALCEAPAPTPSPELVMVVHGHGANAVAIAKDPVDLLDPEKSTYRQWVESLIGVFGEIEVFEYEQDLAAGGDSQSSVKANAIELANQIQDLRDREPDKKITLIGYSMGSAIIRGYLARFPDAEQDVDAVIFFEGAQQGTWLLKVREGLSLWTVASRLAAPGPAHLATYLLLTGVDALAFDEFNIDVSRPAAVDLTPQSEWLLSVNKPITEIDRIINTEPVPPQISYYNFYGDIFIELDGLLGRRFRLLREGSKIPLGDLILLPGDDSPTATPLLGGARFTTSVDSGQRSEQWALTEPLEFDLGSLRHLLRGKGKKALTELFASRSVHVNVHENVHDIMVDDRVAGGGTVTLAQEFVEIIRSHTE